MRLREGQREWMGALGVTLVAAAVVAPLLGVGWVPSDEGTLAQSALRVAHGQWPHRDFAEIYTGGLSVWNALWFRLLGVNLRSLRIGAFTGFVLWAPAVWAIARRWLSGEWAAVVVLAAVGWSYPNYTAAMPSWYNLFFATWSVLAVFRWIDGRRQRWLAVAGGCAGASVCVKITGLYLLAGLLVFCLYAEQEQTATDAERGGAGAAAGTGWMFRAACGAGLAGFAYAVLRLLRGHLGSGEVVQFLLPAWLCVGAWGLRERGLRGGTVARAGRLLRHVGAVLAGFLVPVGVLLGAYALRGGAGALVHGVFGSAGERLGGLAGRDREPGAAYTLYALVPMVMLWCGARWRAVAPRWMFAGMAAFVLGGVVIASAVLPGLQDTWMMLGTALPLVTAWGLAEAVRPGGAARRERERALLLIAVASVCALAQFPVSYVTYFCYVAPLVLLAGVGVWVLSPARQPMVGAAVLLFVGLLGWCGVVSKHVYDPGLRYGDLHRLGGERGGALHVPEGARRIEDVAALAKAHSPNGMLYAGNDCPEIYFLSGLENPTRDDTGADARAVEAALATGALHVVVLNDAPFFAASRVPEEVRAAVAAKLPQHTVVGDFSVYWDR